MNVLHVITTLDMGGAEKLFDSILPFGLDLNPRPFASKVGMLANDF